MTGMDFKSAGARVRSLVAQKKPQQLSASALTPDKLRDNVIDETVKSSPRFEALTNETPRVEVTVEDEDGQPQDKSFDWNGFGEAVKDVARAGYGYEEPQVRPREQMRPSSLFNREVIQKVIRRKEFVDSRPYTEGNARESMFGAEGLAHSMREDAPEIAAEHLARAEEMRDAEGQIGDAQDMIDNLRARAKAQADSGQPIDPNIAPQMRKAIQSRTLAQQQLGQLLAQHQQSNATQAAGQVAKAAAGAYQDAVEAAQALNSLPGFEPGTPHNRTPGQEIALAEKLMQMDQLREIAKRVGRMRMDMRAKRQAKSRDVKIQPVGIETGRDITRLMPHELARMQVPALRPLWLQDWSNHSLLQWRMGGKTPADMGPAGYVYDGSGSMSGEPILWAAACGLSVLTLMQAEKRDFFAVQFGSSGQFKTWFFPGAESPDPDQVVDFATHFFAGGTDNCTGLREAKRIIEEVPAFEKADVILVSDGQDYFQAEDRDIVRALDDMGVRIHGISIMAPGNAYLEQACEYVVDIEDVVGVNDATDALAENLTI